MIKKDLFNSLLFFIRECIAGIGLLKLLKISGCFSCFLFIAGQLSALDSQPAFNINQVKENSFHWLISESDNQPQNLANYLFFPLFALNLSVDPKEKKALESLLINRITQISGFGQAIITPSKNHFFDYVLLSYSFFKLNYQEKHYQNAVRTLLQRNSFEELSPPNKESFFSVEETNRLMLLFMLEKMRMLSPESLFQFIDNARKKYNQALNGDSDYQREQLLYFITHVVFIKSDLGLKTVLNRTITDERKILISQVDKPFNLKNNDLWPEIYLALSMIDGCPSKAYTPEFTKILQSQCPKGNWEPSTLKSSSTFHTTSVIYFAILGQKRCR